MTRSSFEIARQIGMTAEKRVDPADALPQPLRKDFLTAMAALDKAKTPEEVEKAREFAFDVHAKISELRDHERATAEFKKALASPRDFTKGFEK